MIKECDLSSITLPIKNISNDQMTQFYPDVAFLTYLRAKCIMAVEYLLINFSVTIFSDYSGLFQIKSSDDDSTTVGTPLVYGQVFKLVTVKVCFSNLLCLAFWSDTCHIDNIHIKMYFFLICNFKCNIEMTRLFNLAYISFNLTNEELKVFIVL